MAKTTITGPLRTGKDTGVPTTRTIGTVEVVQRATVEVGAMKAFVVLPANAEITDFNALVSEAVAGIAAGVNIRFGTSADATQYGTIPVSAAGLYRAQTVSAAAITALDAGDVNLIAIDATAQASAANLTTFKAIAHVRYIQKD